MPTPPRILDELQKKRARKEIYEAEEIAGRDQTSFALLCSKCNVEMHSFIDPKTRAKAGLMCPVCEKRILPGQSYQSTQKLEAKKKKMLTTFDGVLTKNDLIGRRDTVSLEPKMRESLYTNEESAADTFQKMGYAGKKKKTDPDEQLLKSQGMTILKSTETMPT